MLRFKTWPEVKSSIDFHGLFCAAIQDNDRVALRELRRIVTDIEIYNAEFRN